MLPRGGGYARCPRVLRDEFDRRERLHWRAQRDGWLQKEGGTPQHSTVALWLLQQQQLQRLLGGVTAEAPALKGVWQGNPSPRKGQLAGGLQRP